MKNTKQFIIDAIAGGYPPQLEWYLIVSKSEEKDVFGPITTDKNAWVAVGKTRGWHKYSKDGIWKPGNLDSVHVLILEDKSIAYKFHSFIGYLLDDFSTEDALGKI